MLKTLLKKQMAEIFRNYFYDPKKNKMRSRGATIAYIALYVLLMVGLLGGIFALMAVGLCGPLVEGGMDWLYYLLMGLIAVFLGTFGSVFSTYSSLYLSKDNDLLLSMPIPVRCVMASRLLGVYLLGLMYAAVVIVPGVIVYWLTAPVTAGTIVGGVLMVLLVSVIVMVLSCLLGWVVARISLKLKNKSFITVILSLLFLAAYYFVYYKAQALITLLVENAAVYGMKIRGSAYLLYLFGCVGAGDWLAMLIVTVTQAALLALTLWGIARSFLKIATATGSVKKVRFEHKAVRAQSTQRALFGKELRRFTAMTKLLYLGIDCQYYTDYYLQRISASSLHQDDTVIAISYSGQSKDVVDTVKIAKKAGAKVVVITNFGQTLLEKWGDVVLKSSQKQLLYGDAIFSRTTQMALIDMLYMGIILSDYEKYTHQLDKSSKVVRDKAYS